MGKQEDIFVIGKREERKEARRQPEGFVAGMQPEAPKKRDGKKTAKGEKNKGNLKFLCG